MVLTSKRFSVASFDVMAKSATTPDVRIKRTNCPFDFCGHRLFARDHKPLNKNGAKRRLYVSGVVGLSYVPSEKHRKAIGRQTENHVLQ